MREIEYTVGIKTKNKFLDALIIVLPEHEELTEDTVLAQFESYKNDEAGELLKDDELASWEIIRKDIYVEDERVNYQSY